jgi:hypothetical protein
VEGIEQRLRESAMHTLAVDHDTLLYFGGFPDYTDWTRMDLVTHAIEPTVAASCSWEPPPGAYDDQCEQQVGDVRVWVQPYGGSGAGPSGMGLYMQRGLEDPVLLDGAPPYNYSDPGSWDCARAHSGPLEPCLSPDASQVAYVVQDSRALVLRVMAIPEPSGPIVPEVPTPEPVPITEPPPMRNLPPVPPIVPGP